MNYIENQQESISEIAEIVRQRLKPKRWLHTLGCMKLAAKWSEHYGLQSEVSQLTALLHDSWRDVEPQTAISSAKEYGLEISSLQLDYPVLLHGPLASLWAKQSLGITDEAVLEAIYWHTTGREGLQPLSMLIYCIDSLEEQRVYAGVETLRASLGKAPLNEICLAVIEQSISYQLQKKEAIALDTISWRNSLLKQ